MKSVSRPSLLGVEEVAERLGVTPRYVRQMVAGRRIRYVKVGHLLRFDCDDLDSWIERNCAEPIGASSSRSPHASRLQQSEVDRST
jgi:excisionase family DNA binding protein